MKMIVKRNEINKVAKILADNNFINVKKPEKLKSFLFFNLINYHILALKKNFKSVINYNKDIKDYTNYFNLLIDNYNFLFNEAIEIKKENIEIEIVDGGDDE